MAQIYVRIRIILTIDFQQFKTQSCIPLYNFLQAIQKQDNRILPTNVCRDWGHWERGSTHKFPFTIWYSSWGCQGHGSVSITRQQHTFYYYIHRQGRWGHGSTHKFPFTIWYSSWGCQGHGSVSITRQQHTFYYFIQRQGRWGRGSTHKTPFTIYIQKLGMLGTCFHIQNKTTKYVILLHTEAGDAGDMIPLTKYPLLYRYRSWGC